MSILHAAVLGTLTVLAGCSVGQASSPTSPVAGETAPTFTLPDLDGTSYDLSSQQGKVVVLEWFNPGCPFVKEAHGPGGGLATLAKSYTDKGVVWWAVNSGAPGKQGHDPADNRTAAAEWSMAHPILVDPGGDVGRSYDAKTTPQMVIIDAEGKLAYNGAFDNAPMGKVKDGERIPYFANALDQVLAGEEVTVKATKPWGCSVKYQ